MLSASAAVDALDEVRRQQFGLAARLALRVHRSFQEGHGGDAGDLQRVLEGEEDAGGGARIGLHLQHVLAIEQDLAVEDLIVLLAGDDIAQRRFAGAVGAHDRGDLAVFDGEVQAIDDLLVLVSDFDDEIANFEHFLSPSVIPCAVQREAFAPQTRDRNVQLSQILKTVPHLRGGTIVPHVRDDRPYPTDPSSEIVISFCASTANSIGSCCSTSLTKPLTISATASSAGRPRCWQ
jgi:hypothetical protein